MPTEAPLRRLPLMPLAGLAITSIAGIAAILLILAVERANRWVTHTIRTQVAIVQVEERLAAFESAYRGYMIRVTPGFLPQIRGARRDLIVRIAQLRRETADNPQQTARCEALLPLIAARVAEATHYALVRPTTDQRGLDTLGKAARGPRLMAEIHRRLTAMFAEEDRLLHLRQQHMRWLIGGLAVGLAAAVLLVVIVAYLTIGDAQRRSAATELAYAETRAEMARRETAEATLRQMQKMETLGQLTGGIAHDFNNMLAIVIGSLDMARRHAATDPARVADCIDTAMEGADRAAALVARLLAFARQQPLSPAAIDVNALVGGMSTLLRRTLGDGVTIRTSLAPALWRGHADAGQLENALLNLAVNARDAMDGAIGTLTIATANAPLDRSETLGADPVVPGDYIQIAVADTGHGMAADVIARAVEPFFTTKEVGKGTGLGLSQVFGFVHQSGGHVAIESAPGEGTTIRLYLPRDDGPIATESAAPAPAAQGGNHDEVVLVVEDEPLVRAFSAEALRTLGYSVLTAADGPEALAILESDAPVSLLFTDMIMPGMSGEQLVAAARPIRPEMKLLYTTGYRGRGAEMEQRERLPLLPKPFTAKQLAARVRASLDAPS